MVAQVDNPARKTHGGGKLGVSTVGKPNDFTSDAVLLGGKLKRSKSCRQKSGVGSGDRVQANWTMIELDVAETERGRVGLGSRILSRTKQEKEGDADHVGDGNRKGVAIS